MATRAVSYTHLDVYKRQPPTIDAVTDTTSPHPLVQAHLGVLEQGRDLLTARGFLSRYPEVPSARHYGETAAADGRAAYEARLNARFTGLDLSLIHI